MRSKILCLFAFVLVGAVACQKCEEKTEAAACEEKVDIAAEKGAIKATNKDFLLAFNSGDAEGLAKLYTSAGQLLPANSDLVTGTEAIQQFWQTVMDMGIKTAELETVELEIHGQTALEVGRYKLGGEAGKVLDEGKYLVIWKKAEGQWKLHRDIWNTSLPAAGQQ